MVIASQGMGWSTERTFLVVRAIHQLTSTFVDLLRQLYCMNQRSFSFTRPTGRLTKARAATLFP